MQDYNWFQTVSGMSSVQVAVCSHRYLPELQVVS